MKPEEWIKERCHQCGRYHIFKTMSFLTSIPVFLEVQITECKRHEHKK